MNRYALYNELYDEIERAYRVLGDIAEAQNELDIRQWATDYQLTGGECDALRKFNRDCFKIYCN